MLGVTPLDFGPQPCVDALKENLEQYGWEVLSSWAMGDTLETLASAGEAAVNLVVSSVGLRAAQVLQEKFGTPYVVGAPVAGYANVISKVLEHTLEIGRRDELPITENASRDLRGKCCESAAMSKHFRDETIIDAERKELNASRIDWRTSPYGFSGSSDRSVLWSFRTGALSDQRIRRPVIWKRPIHTGRGSDGRSTERCEDHCCRSAV